jgi:hypothetical protein
MGKALVIVESPAKAKTINKYLGKDFVVKSSVGHVRDLPTSGSASTAADKKEGAKKGVRLDAADKAKKEYSSLVSRMGIDPEHGWKARYEILPGKEKVVRNQNFLKQTNVERCGYVCGMMLMYCRPGTVPMVKNGISIHGDLRYREYIIIRYMVSCLSAQVFLPVVTGRWK